MAKEGKCGHVLPGQAQHYTSCWLKRASHYISQHVPSELMSTLTFPPLPSDETSSDAETRQRD